MASDCERQKRGKWQHALRFNVWDIKHWVVPSPSIRMLHPWSSSTKIWPQPVSTFWKNTSCLWRIWLHLMGCRKPELDSPLHYEVQSKLAYSLIMHLFYKHNHSVARSYHTAWTPPSLPNSIVLLGGKGSGERLAEILPGVETKASINHFARWRNICFEEQRVWRLRNHRWRNHRPDRRLSSQLRHKVE